VRTNKDREVTRFRRVALQRFEDAQLLFDGGRNTGAIYLAGYAVECTLKALLLSATPTSKIPKVLDSFRGGQGHDLEWLKRQYIKGGGSIFPSTIARKFARVNSWKTDIRYEPGTSLLRDAEEFLQAAEAVLSWAGERL
jgi:HEPN domain-containing protein